MFRMTQLLVVLSVLAGTGRVYAESNIVREDDMVGWWKMGEGATWNGSNWSVPNAAAGVANGTSANMEQTDRVGGYPFDPYYEPSHAMHFDGTNECVETSYDPSLALTSSFTISAWVNLDVQTPPERTIVGRFSGTLKHNYFFQVDNQRFFFGFRRTSAFSWPKAWGQTVLGTGQWYHLAGVFDDAGDLATAYVNGQPDGTTSFPYTPDASATDFGTSIGGNAAERNRYFDGQIDDVRIYDVALSSSEIAAMYNNAKGDFLVPEPSTLILLTTSAVGLLVYRLRRRRGWSLGRKMIRLLSCCGVPCFFEGGSVMYRMTQLLAMSLLLAGAGQVDADSNIVREDDMVGWWKMGEGATWKGSKWTVPNAAAATANGISANMEQTDRVVGYPFDPYYEPGHAMHLDGVNEYVQTPYHPSLAIASSFTVSSWVNLDVPVPGDRAIVGRYSGSLRHNYSFIVEHNKFNFSFMKVSGGWPKVWGQTILGTGQWYHFAGVFDDAADLATVYVNGQPDGSAYFPYTPDAGATDHGVSIGADVPENNRYFYGKIDDVRIYNAALSGAEIAAMYNNGKGDFLVPEPGTITLLVCGLAAGLIWWRRTKRLSSLGRTTGAMAVLAALSVLPLPCLAQGTPIVDGADSIDGSDSLLIVREKCFDVVDLSRLGMLDEARPVNYISPNPPPWGSSAQTKVQSLFVRAGGTAGVTATGTITFSPGVSIVGVVTEVEDAWLSAPGTPTQLQEGENIFGVGMNYGKGAPGYESDGSGNHGDFFLIDRVANTVTFSAVTAMGGFSDDFRLLISYGDRYGSHESFDVALTSGDGLYVGANYLGPGQQFNGVPLTVPEPSTISLAAAGLLGLALYGRRRGRWAKKRPASPVSKPIGPS